MVHKLFIDFGATRTKSAVSDKDVLTDIMQYNSVSFKAGGFYEISITELLNSFQSIINFYLRNYNIKNIFLSCQMHGFALQDNKNNFITDYVSWQDESAFLPYKGKSSYHLFESNFLQYKDLTGMRLRGCFPVVKILDFLRRNKLKQVKVLSLPEIFDFLGKSKNKVHITMAQASGCFDFDNKEFSKEILDFIRHETGCQIIFNEPTENIDISSVLNINGKSINLFSGVGDHQASVLGALGTSLKGISVNIGTGSQVSQIKNRKSEILENRFFFNKQILNTITHIPAGRVIAKYMEFLNEDSNVNYWDILEQLSVQDVLTANLQFNLALFQDAFGFDAKKAGIISKINTLNLNKKNFIASMMKSFIYQYVNIINNFEQESKIVISGGKLAKNNLLKHILLKEIPNCDVLLSDIIEEALQGLNCLSRRVL